MAQTTLGARKARAAALGLSLEEYLSNESAGLKWCTACKKWQPVSMFGKDSSRNDGLATYCLDSRKTGRPRGWHGKPNTNPLTGRPGPQRLDSRSGDKIQARARVNQLVRLGELPHPNSLPCADCGDTEKRHQYDHHLGYESENHRAVQVVCASCHMKRGFARGENKPPDSTGLKRPGQNDNRPRRADGTFMKGGAV